jgi:hypothetical protein
MTARMTAAELAEAREAIAAALQRFAERDGKPKPYPADARPMRLFTASSAPPATDAATPANACHPFGVGRFQ